MATEIEHLKQSREHARGRCNYIWYEVKGDVTHDNVGSVEAAVRDATGAVPTFGNIETHHQIVGCKDKDGEPAYKIVYYVRARRLNGEGSFDVDNIPDQIKIAEDLECKLCILGHGCSNIGFGDFISEEGAESAVRKAKRVINAQNGIESCTGDIKYLKEKLSATLNQEQKGILELIDVEESLKQQYEQTIKSNEETLKYFKK